MAAIILSENHVAGRGLPSWVAALALVLSILSLGMLAFEAVARRFPRLISSRQFRTFSLRPRVLSTLFAAFELFLISFISTASTVVPPAAFLGVLLALLVANSASFLIGGGGNLVACISPKRSFEWLVTAGNLVRLLSLSGVVVVLYSGYLGFESTGEQFWMGDVDVDTDFIPSTFKYTER